MDPTHGERLFFNAFVMGVVSHNYPGLWRHPDAGQLGYRDIRTWVALARTLERGGFDAIFFADLVGLYGAYNGSWDVHLKEGLRFPVEDSLVLVSALAAVTREIGLVFTASVIQDAPFALAKRISTLDHLSRGRAGWNIVTSSTENAHRNFSQPGLTPHDERYEWAKEYVDVVFKLLEGSWEDDAVVENLDTGVYLDPGKVHRIDHVGERYSVQGPFTSAPSPQRTPFLFQAGSSPAGRDFAARYAEGQFIVAPTPQIAAEQIASVRASAVAHGRKPDDIRFFLGQSFVIGSTMAEARRKYDALRDYVNFDAVAAEAGGNLGADFSSLGLDDPIDLTGNQGGIGPLLALAKASPTGQVTLRQYLDSRSGATTTVGTPESICDQLAEWKAVGVDGINVMNHLIPGSYDEFVDLLAPELRRRSLLQTDYRPGTLREKLLGEGPRVNERHPAAAYRGRFTEPL